MELLNPPATAFFYDLNSTDPLSDLPSLDSAAQITEKTRSENARLGLVDNPGQKPILNAGASISLAFEDDDGLDLDNLELVIARWIESSSPGTPVTPHLDALQAVAPAELSPLFGTTPGAAADPVTRRRGTVDQGPLGRALGLGDRLPDGTYYLRTRIKDNQPHKLPYTLWNPPEAAPVKGSAIPSGFWFAVNTRGPSVIMGSPQENGFVARHPAIVGSITDANGLAYLGYPTGTSSGQAYDSTVTIQSSPPYTARFRDVTIHAEVIRGGSWTTLTGAGPKPLFISGVNWETSEGGYWKYDFALPDTDTLDLSGAVSEEIRLVITAKDIFGAESRLIRTVRRDDAPPTININQPPLMVPLNQEGAGLVNAMANYPSGIVNIQIASGPPVNFVNGVIRFQAAINDFSGVKTEDRTAANLAASPLPPAVQADILAATAAGKPKAKYWFLPQGIYPVKVDQALPPDAANNSYDFDFAGTGTDTGNYPGYYFDARSYVAEWDSATAATPDQEGPTDPPYVLWILAQDNLTTGGENTGGFPLYEGGSLQTPAEEILSFRVHQATDLPRITVSKPDPVTDTAGGAFTIVAIIDDDDGFPANALTYQVDSSPGGPSTWSAAKPLSHTLLNGGRQAKVTHTLSAAEMASLPAGDGPQRIKISALDDLGRKYGEAAVTQAWEHLFVTDSVEPKIGFLGAPSHATAQSVTTPGIFDHPLAENLPWNHNLKPPLYLGLIEANPDLDLASSNRPYIDYQWDGPISSSSPREHLVHSVHGWENNVPDIWTWEMLGGGGQSPRFTSGNSSEFSHGPHYLTVNSRDRSGKAATRQWTFVYDTAGPEVRYTNPTVPGIGETGRDKVVINESAAAAAPGSKDYVRANAPVIAEAIPVLKGTFADEFSAVIPLLAGSWGSQTSPRWAGTSASGEITFTGTSLPLTTFQYRIDVMPANPQDTSSQGMSPSTLVNADHNWSANSDGWRNAPDDWTYRDNARAPIWNLPMGGTLPPGMSAPSVAYPGGSPIPNIGLSLPDGFHWVQFRASDELGNWTESELIGFRLDSARPELKVTSISPDPFHYPGSSFPSHGSDPGADGNPIFSSVPTAPQNRFPHGIVYKTPNNGAAPVFTIQGTIYDANLDLGSYVLATPGSNEIRTDGKLYLELGPDGSGNSFKLPLKVTRPTGTPSEANPYQWEAALTQSHWASLGPDGTKRLRFFAVDLNNWSVEAEWTWVKDTALPEISYANLAKNAGAPVFPVHVVFAENNPRVQGVVRDAHSKLSGLTYSIQKFTYNGSQPPANIFTGIYTGGWNPAQDSVPSVITDKELLGTPASITAPAQPPQTWTVQLGTGGLSLADGLYRMQVKAQDAAVGGDTTVAANIGNRARNSVNATASPSHVEDWLYFFIDREDPQLGLELDTYIRSGADHKVAFKTGFASDLNGLKTVRGKIVGSGSGTTGQESPWTAAILRRAVSADGTPHNTHQTDPDYAMFELSIPGPGGTANWPGGQYRLDVEAEDNAGRVRSLSRNFTLDDSPPILEVTEVSTTGIYGTVNSSPVIDNDAAPYAVVFKQTDMRGQTADAESAVKRLFFAFGHPGAAPAFDPSDDDPNNGTSLTGYKRWRLSGGPASQFWLHEGAAGGQAEGYSETGAGVSGTPGWYGMAFTGSWHWRIAFEDIYVFANYDNAWAPTHGGVRRYTVQVSNNLYYLPLYFLVEDMAGNRRRYARGLTIDTSAGNAVVQFLRPQAGLPSPPQVGGVLRVEGSGEDNNWVQDVLIRIRDGVETGAGSTPIFGVATIDGKTPAQYLANENLSLDDYDTDAAKNMNHSSFATAFVSRTELQGGGWMRVRLTGRGPQVNWFMDINNNRSLDPVGASTERPITVEAVAWNAGNMARTIRGSPGSIQRVTVKFVAGVPEFGSVVRVGSGSRIEWTGTNQAPVYPDPAKPAAFQDKVTGAFTYLTTVNSTGRDLTQILWHDTRTTAYESFNLLTAPSTGPLKASLLSTTGTGPSQVKEYLVSISVNTLNPGDNATHKGMGAGNEMAGKAGLYTLSIRADDNNNPPAQGQHSSIPIPVDNFPPLGRYTGNPKAAGTRYQLQGEAWDTGAKAPGDWPIGKVMVWFTSPGGTYLPLRRGVSAAATTVALIHQGRSDENSGNLVNMAIPVINTAPGAPDREKYAGVVIDTQEFGGDINGNGFLEGFTDGTVYVGPASGTAGSSTPVNGKFWSVELDTTQLPDGPVQLHYVVYDSVGNASYYRYDDMVIRNNLPGVSYITLGTNILGVPGTSHYPYPGEETEYSQNYLNTGFVVRNNYFSVKVKVNGGNAPLNYRLEYISGETSITGGTAGSIQRNQVYAIEDVGTNASWGELGVIGQPEAGKLFIATQNGTAALLGDGKALGYTRPAALKKNALSSLTITPPSVPLNTGEVIFEYKTAGLDFGTGTGKIPNSNPGSPDKYQKDAHFLLSVWDTLDTRPGHTDEWEQLNAYLLFKVKVGNQDQSPPTARLYDLNPYLISGIGAGSNVAASMEAPADHTGRVNNLNKGGLYNKGSAGQPQPSGHIEPRHIPSRNPQENVDLRGGITNSLAFTRDTLSGEVLIRGRASDDQRIKEIYLSIGTTQKLILSASGSGAMTDRSSGRAWAAEVIDFDGHTVEWAYRWDSQGGDSNFPSPVIGQVDIKAEAKDWGAVTNTSVEKLWTAANEWDYNRITVDLAPYVTDMSRSTAAYATNRSKQGWYSASRGESLSIGGYNFQGSPSLLVGGQGTSGVSLSGGRVNFTIPDTDTMRGGVVALTFGSQKVANDRTARVNPWNQEAAPGIAGSELWDDRRGLHVWKNSVNGGSSLASNERAAFSGSAGAASPSMTVNPANGALYAAWPHGGSQQVRRQALTDASAAMILNASDPATNSDIAWHPTAESTIVYEFRQSQAGHTGVTYADDAGILAWNKFAPASGKTDSNANGYPLFDNAYHTTGSGYVDRWANPRVVVGGSGNDTTIYSVAYDRYRYNLWFSRKKTYSGADNFRNTTYSADRRRMRLDGITGTANVSPGVIVASDVGSYSAIDLLPNGYPVVAYYDGSNDTVKVAFCTAFSTAGDTSGNTGGSWTGDTWTVGYALSASDPYFRGSGTYISMRVDSTGKIHLSFYNSRYQSLVYAVGTTANVNGSLGGGGFTSALVDGSSRVGVWSDLSLDQDNKPWITYQDLGRYNNYDGIKIAYLDAVRFTKTAKDPNNLDSSGNPLVDITGWEALTVPTKNLVMDDRLSIEANRTVTNGAPGGTWSGITWSAAVGYLSSDLYRLAYYVKPPLP
jgi:hypothetical protein